MSLIIDHAPVIGLLFFFAVFLFIAFQAYKPGAKQKLQQHAQIPLREE